MAKIDIRSAYRLIPVHPENRLLLGMQWGAWKYIDCVLPFGLRSAPKIFNSVADTLQCVVRRRGARWLFHYLDDFPCLGSPETEECSLALATLLGTCEELHLPLTTEKQMGPASCIEFLGIELDSATMQL